MRLFRVIDLMKNNVVCHGHSAADTLALVLDHANTGWFLHWKKTPAAQTRTWHLVMTRPPTLTLDTYVPYAVDAEDAGEAMVALGRMMIEDRPPGPLDWLGGRYYCHPLDTDGVLVSRYPANAPRPVQVPGTATAIKPEGEQWTAEELELLRARHTERNAVLAPCLDTARLVVEGIVPIHDTSGGFEEPVLTDATGFPGPWTVTVVMADRSWGGREEGGWWFDTFDPFDGYARDRAIEHKIDRLFWNMTEAIAYSVEVEEKCKEWNAEERRRRKDSVISNGVYEAYVYDGYPVRIPAERPMYE